MNPTMRALIRAVLLAPAYERPAALQRYLDGIAVASREPRPEYTREDTP